MGFAEFNLEMEIQLINGNKQNKPILQFHEETQRGWWKAVQSSKQDWISRVYNSKQVGAELSNPQI